jgi:DNA polymerase-1
LRRRKGTVDKTFVRTEFELQQWAFNTNLEKASFDTETTSLDYSQMRILGMSLCNGTRACYIDLDVPEQDKMIEFLKYQFRDKIKKLIAHNIQYDMQVLHKIGITEHTENIFCTQVAAHLLNETRGTSLKDLAHSVLRIPSHLITKWEKVTKDHHSQEFYEYGINDSIWCWWLMERFYPAMQREKLHYLFFKIEMPFQFCLRDLHINGIEVDQEALQAIEDKVYPMQVETEDWLLEDVGKSSQIQKGFWEDCDTRESPINFNSNKQVIPILRDQYGVELTELTTTGERRQREGLPVGHDYYKLDKVVLESLYDTCEFAKRLHKFRMAKDLKDKFTTVIKGCISPDGRLRTSFNDCVATTGRLSSSDPNLQNLRKMNKVLGVECREVFVAPKGKSGTPYSRSNHTRPYSPHRIRERYGPAPSHCESAIRSWPVRRADD